MSGNVLHGDIIAQVNMFCQKGGSDKVYRLTLERYAGGFVVNYANARRGDPLRDGTRTPRPISEAEARALFASIRKEKLKEYTEGEPGGGPLAAAVLTEVEWRAQLLNPWPEADIAQLIEDDDYGAQQKHDGENRPCGTNADLAPFGANRDGAPVALPGEVAAALAELAARVGHIVLASEAFADYVVVHDLLYLKRHDYRPDPFTDRYEVVAAVAEHFGPALRLSPLAVGAAAKQTLYERLRDKAEGMVFKRLAAPFTPGKAHKDQWKVKFYETLSAIVMGFNQVASIQVGLYDLAGRLVPFGNVTLLPNLPPPIRQGEVVEVRYLYAFPYQVGGALYQPVYKGIRTDIAPADCTVRQVKYKSTRAL